MPDPDFDTLDLPPTGTQPTGVPGATRHGGARNRQAPRQPIRRAGIDGHRQVRAAFLVLLPIGQLPAVGTHPVQQLQHALPAVSKVLPQALTRPGPHDRLYLTGADVAGERLTGRTATPS
jgi:hypothetical protein